MPNEEQSIESSGQMAHQINLTRPEVSTSNKKQRMYEEALKELDSLDGMETVKSSIMEALALSNIFQAREKHSLKNEQHALHMIFKGSPGTGKTTVARIVGKLFVGAGLLKKGKTDPNQASIARSPFGHHDDDERPSGDVPFVECTNAEISSAFWGEDEKNVKRLFRQANGGVFFIDEAYSLISRSGHRSGEKVAATIVAEMENRRDSVCVIAAGYSDEMEEFIQYNTGFASRFATVVNFPNYSVPALLKIADGMAESRDYKMSEKYRTALAQRLEKERLQITFGNARTIRNILEESIRKQAKRVFEAHGSTPSLEQLMTLEEEDLAPFSQAYSGKKFIDPFKEMYAQAVAKGIVSGEKNKIYRKRNQENR